VSRDDEAIEPARSGIGDGGASGVSRAGLVEKLMAAVRPEFRADVLVFDPRDPVFGGTACRVPDCARPIRSRGMCEGHHLRWLAAGKPDLGQFAAATDCRWLGRAPLTACPAPGCRYGRNNKGLCHQHFRDWKRDGRPDLEPWLAGLPATTPPDSPQTCRISFCDLWIHPGTRLCFNHGRRWKTLGCPDLEAFVRGYDDEPVRQGERIDLHHLGPQVRLELQYALQCRHDEERTKIPPGTVRRIVPFIAASGVVSLLDWPEETWRQRFPDSHPGSHARAVLLQARRQTEDLAHGFGWDVEYPRDVWRLRTLGIEVGPGSFATLRFGRIPQPWLKDLTKRWVRWRLGGGLGASQAYRSVAVITRFAAFLASPSVSIDDLSKIDRVLLERYLADLNTELAGKKAMRDHLGLLNGLFTTIRRLGWDTSLPANAMFFAEDYPKTPQRLPRYLAEHIMAQVEDPANLDRWDDPARRLLTIILMRCGLRISDAVNLPHDCIASDADGAPYLKYFNHKMKREALVPIDEELHQQIREQQQRVLARWPGGVPVLFSRAVANADGTRALSTSAYRAALYRWLERCDVRDEHGQPVRLTPHQWRHTLGTRLINRDVPQEVVRKILDHDSPAMTSHYARLHDTTVRRHWEQARKVNVQGEAVTLDPDGPLAEAAWAKQRLSRATQALPNGFCGLPLVQECPHANSCLTCPMFLTTAEFLPQHRAHQQQTLQIISAAEARGQARLAEMNRRVADNLEKIIRSLEDDDGEQQQAAADAS